jgi:hypothetical protein
MVNSDADWVSLVRRLADIDMVSFTTDPMCVNGSFGIDKGDGSQRFLFDGRPVNALMCDPDKVELGTPDLVAGMEVPAGERLYVAKEDVCNYFHRLRVPIWMRPYFALQPVRAGDVGAVGFPPDTIVWPCCNTLPMGWSHAPTIAQAVHTFILDNHTSISPADRLSSSTDPRVDRPRHSIYIDDFAAYALERDLPRLRQMLAEYREVMGGFGLPTKLSKRVEPSCDGVEVVGVVVDGCALTVGVSPTKLLALSATAQALLDCGYSTGKQVEQLIGSFSWAFLPRRPAFSVFSSVYRFIACAGFNSYQIWPSVRRELQIAMALAPLLHANIGALWSPRVLASDASTEGQGVVAAVFPVRDVAQMAAAPPPDFTSKASVDRSLHPLLHGARWATIISSPWRRAEHINVLELRALRASVRWATSFPGSVGSRIVAWVDSSVVYFAARKGRSSAFKLLAQMRPLSALLLATGVNLACKWIPTEVNPADEPSRGGW